MLNGQMPKEYDGFDRSKSLSNFAMLINASPEEIAWVPSAPCLREFYCIRFVFAGVK